MTQNKQSTKQDSKYLLTGSLLTISIILIPFALFLYNSLPDVKTYTTVFGTFNSNFYESVRYFSYHILTKLVPLSLFLIWFTTCKHWWYLAIAVPISIYIFQLISVINDDARFIEEYDFIYSLPVTLIILIILYYIRSKISIFLKAKDLKRQVEDQMSDALEKMNKRE